MLLNNNYNQRAIPTSINRSASESVQRAQDDQRLELPVGLTYENVARDIARRARRRVFAATLPLLSLMLLLAYVFSRFGL